MAPGNGAAIEAQSCPLGRKTEGNPMAGKQPIPHKAGDEVVVHHKTGNGPRQELGVVTIANKDGSFDVRAGSGRGAWAGCVPQVAEGEVQGWPWYEERPKDKAATAAP